MKYLFTVLAMLLAVASWPVYAAKDHLACYEIEGGKAKKKVKIFDQFFPDPKNTNVRDSALLCDPAEKKDVRDYTLEYAPEAEPEFLPQRGFVYKCYEVQPRRDAKKSVTVTDQFFKRDYVSVKKLKYLCTPAKKFHKDD
jgi:hypothetical protein